MLYFAAILQIISERMLLVLRFKSAKYLERLKLFRKKIQNYKKMAFIQELQQKGTPSVVLTHKFCENFQSSCFFRHLWMAAGLFMLLGNYMTNFFDIKYFQEIQGSSMFLIFYFKILSEKNVRQSMLSYCSREQS